VQDRDPKPFATTVLGARTLDQRSMARRISSPRRGPPNAKKSRFPRPVCIRRAVHSPVAGQIGPFEPESRGLGILPASELRPTKSLRLLIPYDFAARPTSGDLRRRPTSRWISLPPQSDRSNEAVAQEGPCAEGALARVSTLTLAKLQSASPPESSSTGQSAHRADRTDARRQPRRCEGWGIVAALRWARPPAIRADCRRLRGYPRSVAS